MGKTYADTAEPIESEENQNPSNGTVNGSPVNNPERINSTVVRG